MGLKDCKIVLDKRHNVYHPGEIIKGYVEYTFDSVKKVRGVYITFKGYAETCWLEERANKPRVTVKCYGKEEYFEHSYYLLGDVIAFKEHKLEIPAGTHRYPFVCTLPSNIPSSFEGEYGFVRYTIKTTLDRPWTFNQEAKMAFTIVDHYDLNMIPECKMPLNIQMDETFCCYWCRSSPMTVKISAPYCGYSSGQEIPLNIDCDNNSDVDVSAITITFRQVVKYTCEVPIHEIKIVRRDISQITLDGVVRKSKLSWKKYLRIPPLPPTSLKNCNIIDIHYDLKVKCMHIGLHPDIKAKVALAIGTIPVCDVKEAII